MTGGSAGARGRPIRSPLGAPRLHLRRTDSTNERLRALAIAGAPHGALVSADEQTAGRGRHGRSWLAPPRTCLLCSLLLRGTAGGGAAGGGAAGGGDGTAEGGGRAGAGGSEGTAEGGGRAGAGGSSSTAEGGGRSAAGSGGAAATTAAAAAAAGGDNAAGEPQYRSAGTLSLLAGVAVCDVVGGAARLKWPNDVVIGERLAKVAGILVEARPQDGWAIVGVGVNVALDPSQLPREVRSRAASMERPADAIEPLLAELLQALSARLEQPAAAVLDRWRALDALRGRRIAWSGGSGVADGIDNAGRLLVRGDDGGVSTLDAGDVHLSAAA